MKPIAQRLRLYGLLTLILTAVGTVGQFLAIHFGYSQQMGVYSQSNPIGPIVGWCLFAFVLLLAGFALLLPKESDVTPVPPCGNGLAFLSAMSGGIAICASLFMLLDVMKTTGPIKTLSLLLVILSLPAGYYLIRSATTRKTEDKLLTILGFFPVLWLAVCLIRIYFDRTSAINDPVQLLLQLSLAAIMLYFLTELRSRVGKPDYRLRLAAGGVATLLGMASSGTLILLYFGLGGGTTNVSGGLNRTVVTRGELFLAVAELLMALYAAGRLAALLRTKGEAAEDASAEETAEEATSVSDGKDASEAL